MNAFDVEIEFLCLALKQHRHHWRNEIAISTCPASTSFSFCTIGVMSVAVWS
jgi:hypothetical protein